MKIILFVSTENSIRSQMAEGMARHFLGHQFDTISAGNNPTERVHPMAKAVMAEIGIDISKHRPKAIARLDLSKIDTAVFLHRDDCGLEMPNQVKKIVWQVHPLNENDFSKKNEQLLKTFRKVRDQIRHQVLGLRAADQTW